jgi:hypothetical protein
MANEEDALIDDLILAGALEIAGIDDKNGEFLYNMTNKMKDLMPELYEEHLSQINQEIMKLWENGFVNIDMASDDPLVTLTSKAYDIIEISKLSMEDKWSLEEIKRLMDPKV